MQLPVDVERLGVAGVLPGDVDRDRILDIAVGREHREDALVPRFGSVVVLLHVAVISEELGAGATHVPRAEHVLGLRVVAWVQNESKILKYKFTL